MGHSRRFSPLLDPPRRAAQACGVTYSPQAVEAPTGPGWQSPVLLTDEEKRLGWSPHPKAAGGQGSTPKPLQESTARALGQRPCRPPSAGPPCPSTTLSTDKGRWDRADPTPHCGSHLRTTQPASSTSPGHRPCVLCRPGLSQPRGLSQPCGLPELPAECLLLPLPYSLSDLSELGDISSLGFLFRLLRMVLSVFRHHCLAWMRGGD